MIYVYIQRNRLHAYSSYVVSGARKCMQMYLINLYSARHYTVKAYCMFISVCMYIQLIWDITCTCSLHTCTFSGATIYYSYRRSEDITGQVWPCVTDLLHKSKSIISTMKKKVQSIFQVYSNLQIGYYIDFGD